jgi:hypothetical protein
MRLLIGFDHRAIGVKILIETAVIVVYALGIVKADDRSDLGVESLGGVECVSTRLPAFSVMCRSRLGRNAR